MKFLHRALAITGLIFLISYLGCVYAKEKVPDNLLKYLPKYYRVEKFIQAKTIDNKMDYIILTGIPDKRIPVLYSPYVAIVLHPKNGKYIKHTLFIEKTSSGVGNIEAKDINNDGVNEIIVTIKGPHGYSEFYIFRWVRDVYKTLWHNKSFAGEIKFVNNKLILEESKHGEAFFESMVSQHIEVIKEYKWDPKSYSYKFLKEYEVENPYWTVDKFFASVKKKKYKEAENYLHNAEFINTDKVSFYKYISSMKDFLIINESETERTDSHASFKSDINRIYGETDFKVDLAKIKGKWKIIRIELLK